MTTAGAHNDRFDVAVIGAGPAGSAAARWLALRGARVVLIERTSLDMPRVGESLASAVQPLLAMLGLWTDFLALRPLPSFGTCSYWGEDTPQVHSHMMSPWGCGWHVDRLSFDRMLAEGACRAGAVLLLRTTLANCETTPTGWRFTLREPGTERVVRKLSARILIDATGRAARCATHMGTDRLPLDQLVATAVRLDGADVGRESYVMVETTADGWWYSAPIPGGKMIAMLMTDVDLCRQMRLNSSRSWEARLDASTFTAERLSRLRRLTAPQLCSAASHRLRRSGQPQVCLAVGDAALAVDPVSGSGVVRALRTARAGAEATGAVLETGSPDALSMYEAERDFECTRYLEERALYYGFERRWAGQPFWERRSAVAAR